MRAPPRPLWGGRRGRLPAVFFRFFVGGKLGAFSQITTVVRSFLTRGGGGLRESGEVRPLILGPCALVFTEFLLRGGRPVKPAHGFSLRVLKCCGCCLLSWLFFLFFPQHLKNIHLQTTSKINANVFVSLRLQHEERSLWCSSIHPVNKQVSTKNKWV